MKRRWFTWDAILFAKWFYFYGGGDSEASPTTASSTAVTDQRVGVSDQGVAASGGGSVDQSSNDSRSFDDHSVFSIDTRTSTTDSNNDNRQDNREFSTVNEDNRDLSDHSSFSNVDSSTHTTNITNTTLDADVARAATESARASAEAAARAAQQVGSDALTTAKRLSEQSTQLFDSAVKFGEGQSGKAFDTLQSLAAQSFSATSAANDKAMGFSKSVFDGAAAILKDALGTVKDSADADRAFASNTASKIFDTAKSADQQNVEKIIKFGSYLVGGIVAVWGLVRIFGKARQ